MSRVAWYAGRAASMGPAELAWRAGRWGRTVLGDPLRPDPTADLDGFRARPGLLDREHARVLAERYPSAAAEVVDAADRARAHRFRYFGLPEARYPGAIDWSLDPLTGYRWPDRPAHRIDHRRGPGDPKWIWELNRLQHLPLLAQAWLLTGTQRYADEALEQLDGWTAANPPGRGIAWRGAFEAGVRAVSVVTALQGLRDNPALTRSRFRRAVTMLDVAARVCWRDRSLHSSANNHLVGELAGLAAVAIALPDLPGSADRERRALDGLVREAGRQILPDGAGAEQAASYQVFTAELIAVVIAMLRARGDEAPVELTAALRRGAGYLAAVVGTRDPDPRYGDDDEGVALRMDAAPTRTVRAHLAAVAALTGDPDATTFGTPDLAAGWFSRAAPVRPRIAVEPPAAFHAPHGGLVVLRAAGRRVTMDVGPLGFLTLAAHGHADSLAVTLALDGRDVIGDPGTSSYYRHPDRRAVHRGTRVHPTVCLDGHDQSEVGGPFLWTRHARTTLLTFDPAAGVVDARHDGYTPFVHRRRVVCPPDGAPVLVLDLLHGASGHRAVTSWPLAPDLHADPDAAGHRVARAGVPVLRIAHAATVGVTPYAVRGDETTGLGWWSHRLEQRERSWLVGVELTTSGPLTAVATLLGSACVTDLAVRIADDRVAASWTEDGRARHVVVPAAEGLAALATDRVDAPVPDGIDSPLAGG